MLIFHILAIICRSSVDDSPKDIGNFFERIENISESTAFDSESGSSTQDKRSTRDFLEAIEAVSMEETSDETKNDTNFLKALIDSESGNGSSKKIGKKMMADQKVYKQKAANKNSTSDEDSTTIGGDSETKLQSRKKKSKHGKKNQKKGKGKSSSQYGDAIDLEKSSELRSEIEFIARESKLEEARAVRKAQARAAEEAQIRAAREEESRAEIEAEARAAKEEEENLIRQLNKDKEKEKQNEKQTKRQKKQQKKQQKKEKKKARKEEDEEDE